MTFFNYEILQFLIEKMGSPNDRHDLQKFLQEFKGFCRQSVFEIPHNLLGHSAEKVVYRPTKILRENNQTLQGSSFGPAYETI